MVKKIKLINQLQKLSNIKFNDNLDTYKYYIEYDHIAKCVGIGLNWNLQKLPFNIYFATKEDCLNAIKKIGEDNLKKYYFDVVD